MTDLRFGAYRTTETIGTGALSTIFGAAGFWEPTIAFVPLTLGELVSRRYYSRPMGERSQTLRLLNALKCGFLFGVVTDALKLAG